MSDCVHVEIAAEGLKLTGELDIGSHSELAEAFRHLIDAGLVRINLDLADVFFIDCSSLDFLIRMRDRLQEDGGELSLRSPSRQVLRLLELTGTELDFVIK